MLLGLKTDNPVAELYLYDNEGMLVAEEQWQADRGLARHLLAHIDQLFATHGVHKDELRGICVYQGPGSYTGLRIGITVANTLAYALGTLIVAGQGADWKKIGIMRLLKGENDQLVMPLYGGEPRVTEPKG